jgi:hypothetical protein
LPSLAGEHEQESRYQGIDDTIVQLSISQASVLIARMNSQEQFRNSAYEDEIHLAERELSAFINAVKELFGSEEAMLSAEDWLDESDLMDSPPRSTIREWRAVTVAASARLACRVTVAPDHRTPAGSSDTKASPILSSNCFRFTLLV